MNDDVLTAAGIRAINMERRVSQQLVQLYMSDPTLTNNCIDILYTLLDLIEAYKTIIHDYQDKLDRDTS